MAKYTPPKVSGEFKKGERGEAQVKIPNKNTVMVRFTETKNVYKFRRTKGIAKLRPGRWYIQLNGDEDEIFAFHPWAGQFKVRVESFAAKEGEPPTPKVNERRNKDGGEYTTVDFTAILEIVEPEQFAGISVPYFLRYNFREAKDKEGRSVVGLPDRGSRTKQLSDFLDYTGAWNRGPMKWMDNVLPAFEKRILREAKEFNIIIKGGWIDTLFVTEEPDVEDADWEEDTTEDESLVESAPPADDEDEISWELDE